MRKKILKTIGIKVNVVATVRDAKTGKIKQVFKNHNKIPTVGLTAIAASLAEGGADTILIRYVEVGTGTNAPAAGDTGLQTALSRITVSSGDGVGTSAFITGFFPTTSGNGALKEAGLFIGGTASLGTGTLFSRVVINVTKTSSDTLTLDWTVTVTSLT